MGKKNKKRNRSEATQKSNKHGENGSQKSIQSAASNTSSKHHKHPNPLFQKQNKFLEKLSELERMEFFSPKIASERRAELWMEQAELGEELVNRYAWATPNNDAIKILKEFSPLVEIGCGSNAYWCKVLRQAGIDIIGYDIDNDKGGIISDAFRDDRNKTKHNHKQANQPGPIFLKQGGPEVLASQELKRSGRTLFLCYPDESDLLVEGDEDVDHGIPTSMGWQCLDIYEGEYVVHVGELFLDSNYSLEQAPWGRSSAPEFQQRLANEFHCLLKVALPNWLHTRDSISVWKRSRVEAIVFAADEDEEDDEDEEIEYRHIPREERLPENLAAPCLAHLLPPSKPQRRNVGGDTKLDKDSAPGSSLLLGKQSNDGREPSRKKLKDSFSDGGAKWEDLEPRMTDGDGNYKTPW